MVIYRFQKRWMAVTLNGQGGASVLRHVEVACRKDSESVLVLPQLSVVWTVAILVLRSNHVNVITPLAQVCNSVTVESLLNCHPR